MVNLNIKKCHILTESNSLILFKQNIFRLYLSQLTIILAILSFHQLIQIQQSLKSHFKIILKSFQTSFQKSIPNFQILVNLTQLRKYVELIIKNYSGQLFNQLDVNCTKLVYYKNKQMKIKFIPKKVRQELKDNKEKTTKQKQSKKLQVFAQIKQGKLHSQQTNHQSQNYTIQLENAVAKQNQQSNYRQKMMEEQEQQKIKQERQRSRDFKQRNKLSTEQLQERDFLKKKYLGLVKQQKSKRNSLNYRNNILFQWDKQDDTFKQSGYLGSTILKANEKFGRKFQDHVNKEKTVDWKTKKYQQMTQRDWRIFREDNQIYIKGGRVPTPIRQWKQTPQLNQVLLKNFQQLKYERPRPIQMQAISIGFQKRDLIAIAPTGQGKTLAYLVPIINFILPLQRITGINSQKGPYALVLAPSRQLAEQIQNQFIKIAKGLNMESIRLVGGKQLQLQSISLWKGADIIIGTPGRIKQMVQKRHLSLQRLSWVVIDQADKMISQNLSQQIEYILQNSSSQSVLPQELHKDKVAHMFSATMVPQIQKMVKTYLTPNPSYITIGEPGGGKKEIEQFVELLADDFSKTDRLGRILRNLLGPIIIFVNQRDSCQSLVKKIEQRWYRSVADYHGGKTQQTRQKVINLFRTGKVQILVATDLAGRGLDVKGINAVINYDAPKNISEFIHRSGRTGRAGMKGKCFTFLTGNDENIFYDVRVFLQRNSFHVPQNLKSHPSAIVKPGTIVKVAKKKQIVYTN